MDDEGKLKSLGRVALIKIGVEVDNKSTTIYIAIFIDTNINR